MKKHEIKIGGHYVAKISGKLTAVRVDMIREVESRVKNFALGTSRANFSRILTYFDVTNLATGRKTTFRSAAKFRYSASCIACGHPCVHPSRYCPECVRTGLVPSAATQEVK